MKRLKIAEQIIIVVVTAVLLPLCIASVVVINVNQHAVRKELNYSVSIIADSVYQRLVKSIEEKKQSINYISESLSHIESPLKRKQFLDKIIKQSPEIEKIETGIISSEPKFDNLTYGSVKIFHDKKHNKLLIIKKISANNYLEEQLDINKLGKDIFKPLNNVERQIYIIDSEKNPIMSFNFDQNVFSSVISNLPQNVKPAEEDIFGKIKNQPNSIIKLHEPEWSIIVATPKHATNYSIIKARYKIILAILVAVFSIMLLCAAYIVSLYVNIRQLFKAITAIGKGNYSRRIRLITDLFTPYEVIFLSNEFNKMAEKIDKSYKALQKSNKKLRQMDEFKSNLIDTVSHELRTPLTSIKGYTSTLIKFNDQLDADTRIKSLKVIKQQSERLSRMVEDLLVIPDIESSLIRVMPEEINLKEIIETCILFINQKDSRIFNFQIDENLPGVYADPDRVEQIIINLLENAVKYSYEDSEISIKVKKSGNFAKISIHNFCETIPQHKLKTLFDKFTRLEDDLTRTTRGTGLGLFIVKGLVEAMNGTIQLNSKDGFEVQFTLPLFVNKEENLLAGKSNESEL